MSQYGMLDIVEKKKEQELRNGKVNYCLKSVMFLLNMQTLQLADNQQFK